MNGTAMEMPPFKRLAAALRKTTEHLARELVQPSVAPPDWTELEWAIARSVAAMQGTSTLLANNLRWRGPPAWQLFLAEQSEQSVLRDARIGELLQRLDGATQNAEIGCVGLKGAALRALGLYRPGERPMGDVDLLVRTVDLPSAEAVMRAIDYREAYTTQRHAIYEPERKAVVRDLGEHVDNPLRIEIHTEVSEPLPVRMVDITLRLQPVSAQLGLNAYPSTAALMLHLLLHAAGNMLAHALRQIQLHDIAELARRLTDGDWGTLLATPRSQENLWWAFAPLALTARYYPGSIPPKILGEVRVSCPLQLRLAIARDTLTDVSWSNLRIHAFPGIAWSRTPVEALRYVRSRVVPSRKSMADLQACVQAAPQLSRIPWYGIPHHKRIARWLFSRPPRVQTMMCVAAALETERAR